MAAQFSISVSPDNLTAFLVVVARPGSDEYPAIESIESALEAKGVTTGIRHEVIAEAVRRKAFNRRIPVAQGIAPQSGEPGRLEFLVDMALRGRPREREDGSVNMRDLHAVVFVHAGERLVQRIPARPGSDGLDVFGRIIAAPSGTQAVLRPGPGTCIAPDDPDILIAAIDGDLIEDEAALISVVHAKVVDGDVDYSVGNIEFEGDLTIRGSVRSGFHIVSEGCIVVLGMVEDAMLSAGGDIEIRGGVRGTTSALVKSGGSITVHHVEHCQMRAIRDVVITEDCLYGDIRAGGAVRSRDILGGRVSAREGISARCVGNSSEVRTILDFDGEVVILEEKAAAMTRRDRFREQISELDGAMFELVCASMDEEGLLNSEQEAQLAQLKTRKEMALRQFGLANRRLETLDRLVHHDVVPLIKARRMDAGTVLKHKGCERTLQARTVDAAFSIRAQMVIDARTGREVP